MGFELRKDELFKHGPLKDWRVAVHEIDRDTAAVLLEEISQGSKLLSEYRLSSPDKRIEVIVSYYVDENLGRRKVFLLKVDDKEAKYEKFIIGRRSGSGAGPSYLDFIVKVVKEEIDWNFLLEHWVECLESPEERLERILRNEDSK